MKSVVLSFLTALFIFNFPASAQQISWLKDFKEAGRIAVESGKPMLIDFTATWCKPCREMERDFWTRADVIEISKDFVCVKADLNENPKLADRYGVESLPNMIMTDSWGFGLDFHRGFGLNAKEEIIEKLRGVPKDFSEIKEAEKVLASNKNNLKALSKIADFYQSRKLYYLSSEFYNRILKLEKIPTRREILMLNLGYNYLNVGWNEEARNIFKRFKKEFPNSPQIEKVNRDLANL